ncbi:succinate dehydrogenase, hydrophobic membrane anchor protein [soil metagenome]
MANNNIGSKRLTVGAHYGLKDWMAQRATAIIMAAYTFILLFAFLFGHDFSYIGWAGLFAQQWFKMVTFVTLLALFYHAWVGRRDIWMDYSTFSVVLRLTLEVATIAWLIGCVFYTAQILWRV